MAYTSSSAEQSVGRDSFKMTCTEGGSTKVTQITGRRKGDCKGGGIVGRYTLREELICQQSLLDWKHGGSTY